MRLVELKLDSGSINLICIRQIFAAFGCSFVVFHKIESKERTRFVRFLMHYLNIMKTT